MDNINKKKALNLYLNKLKDKEDVNLENEIKEIFGLLNTAQIEKLLLAKQINYLKEVGIDEDKLYKVIEKIKDEEYYILCCEYQSGKYWDDYDYTYIDKYNICSVIKEAIEYVDTLFNEKQYEKALKIGKKLAFLEIESKTITEYDDDPYESELISVSDLFYKVGSKVDINKFIYQVFALLFTQQYNYDDLVKLINTYSFDYLKDFKDSLIYVIDEKKCKDYLLRLLIDDKEKNMLQCQVVALILYYLDDRYLYESFVFDNLNFSDSLFNRFYEYLVSKKLDASSYVFRALPLLINSQFLEKYYKIASHLDENDSSLKISLYKINSSDENFFYLYTMKETKIIPSLVKKDEFHIALASLDLKDIEKIRLDQCIFMLEILVNKMSKINEDDQYLNNLNCYRNKQNIDDKLIDNIFKIAIDKLNLHCQSILGKDRKSYYYLADHLFMLDYITDFKLELKKKYTNKYSSYPAFIREVNSAYSSEK